MKLDDLTIGEAKQLASLFSNAAPTASPYIGQYVLVRTYSAGVHFGYLRSHNGIEVTLTEARRLWSWQGAFTLSEVSQDGIKDGKVCAAVPELLLTQAIEIIPMSAKAKKQLEGYKEHRP